MNEIRKGNTELPSPVETKDKVGAEIQHSNIFFACRLIGLNQSHPTELNYTAAKILSHR